MKTMDASKVRKSFSRVVEAVRDGGDELLITRYGRPVAALVRIERLSPEERKIVERQLSERAAIRRRTTE
jgi:prevent-host-death family protein